jgi:RNA polymerase sigma factor (TIGR02999 family)
MHEITQALEAVGRGEPQAADALLPLVYDELRELASRQMAQERPGQTLDATALVHEAYLRVAGGRDDPAGWDNRRHFYAAAAQAMRRILVENARRKLRIKHGGGHAREAADLEAIQAAQAPEELLHLHEALEGLAREHPEKARLVELRFFGGLTLDEAAAALGLSPSTADRAWRFARAWLYSAMDGGAGSAGPGASG